MARFTLKTGKSLKDLGKAIFDLGAIHFSINTTTDLSSKSALEDKQIEGEQYIENQILNPNPTTILSTTTQIEYHYDGIDPATGVYMMHIVVPDMNGKTIDAQKFDEPEFDLSDFATECMGHIVIFGCGK